jgi:hypothetical protein
MGMTNRDSTIDKENSLERELERAQMMYKNVVGLQGRLRWRREIQKLEAETARDKKEEPTLDG